MRQRRIADNRRRLTVIPASNTERSRHEGTHDWRAAQGHVQQGHRRGEGAVCAAIVDDPTYRKKLIARAKAGELAPAIEAMLWHYAYGKPKERVEHAGGITLSWG